MAQTKAHATRTGGAPRKAKPCDGADVDAYIAAFPKDVARKLTAIRTCIRTAVPDAREHVSYRMPAYTLDGPVMYFAAFKAHIGLYPMTADVQAAFKHELAGYETSKGTVRLPLDAPLPLKLIGKLAKFRAAENATRAVAKQRARTAAKPAERR